MVLLCSLQKTHQYLAGELLCLRATLCQRMQTKHLRLGVGTIVPQPGTGGFPGGYKATLYGERGCIVNTALVDCALPLLLGVKHA